MGLDLNEKNERGNGCRQTCGTLGSSSSCDGRLFRSVHADYSTLKEKVMFPLWTSAGRGGEGSRRYTLKRYIEKFGNQKKPPVYTVVAVWQRKSSLHKVPFCRRRINRDVYSGNN